MMKNESKVSFIEIESVNEEQSKTPYQESPRVYNSAQDFTGSFDSLTLGENTIVKRGLSSFVATCYVLNVLMGTGFLTLPRAFEGTGIVLGPILMFIITLLCMAAKDVMLDVLAWAEINIPDKDMDGTRPSSRYSFRRPRGTSISSITVDRSLHYNREDLPMVGRRKLDLSFLCKFYFGSMGEMSYIVLIGSFIIGTLSVYTVIFANTFNHLFPFDSNRPTESYRLYVCIYGIIMFLLTCIDLKETQTVQMTLSLCRFFMVLFMLITLFLGNNCPNAANISDDEGLFSNQTCAYMETNGVTTFDVSGISGIISVSVFAFIYHQNIPNISHIVENKGHLSHIFNGGMVICFIFYNLLSISIAYYFGPNTDPQSNLMWSNYNGPNGQLNWLTTFMKFFILLFPSFDVSSAFPIQAHTLSSEIISIWLQGNHDNFYTKVGVSLFVVIIPVIIALLTTDVFRVTAYTGSLALLVAFTVPAILHITISSYSNKRGTLSTPILNPAYDDIVNQNEIKDDLNKAKICLEKTHYSTSITRTPWAVIGLALFGIVGMIYCIIDAAV